MQAAIEYSKITTSTAVLDVDDVGNVNIKASTDIGDESYLIIRTNLGISYVFTYGPINPDIQELPGFVSCTLNKFPYNEKLLLKTIEKFINKNENITSAEIVDNPGRLLDCCDDLIDYMRQNKLY